MTQPFIWIGIHKIKEGKADDLKRMLKEFPDFIEENEPRLLAFNFYLNEEEDQMAVVQVHPDAESFEFHMKVAGEHISQSYGLIEETVSTQIYGTPSERVLEMVEGFRQEAGQKETLRVMSQPVSGFTRLGNG